MKCILAIETSSSVLSLALQKDGGPMVEKSVEGYLSHVENIIPLLDQMLRSKGMHISDVDTFLIGRGPGSFTGLRVGFATIKAFQKIQKRNCFGASSLDMIAAKIIQKENDCLAVCLDAHRSRIYSKFFIRKGNDWKAQTEIQLLSLEALAEKLPENTWIAGNALIRYQDYFKMNAPSKKWRLLAESEGIPRASALIDLMNKQDSRIQKLETLSDFVPLYLRLSEAEERRNEHAAAS